MPFVLLLAFALRYNGEVQGREASPATIVMPLPHPLPPLANSQNPQAQKGIQQAQKRRRAIHRSSRGVGPTPRHRRPSGPGTEHKACNHAPRHSPPPLRGNRLHHRHEEGVDNRDADCNNGSHRTTLKISSAIGSSLLNAPTDAMAPCSGITEKLTCGTRSDAGAQCGVRCSACYTGPSPGSATGGPCPIATTWTSALRVMVRPTPSARRVSRAKPMPLSQHQDARLAAASAVSPCNGARGSARGFSSVMFTRKSIFIVTRYWPTVLFPPIERR